MNGRRAKADAAAAARLGRDRAPQQQPEGGGAAQPGGAERSDKARPGALAHPDWLYHRLTIDGPDLVGFRKAAAGAGIIPWSLDLDRNEEDWFHLLVSPPPPQQRTLSLAGARMLAGQLRDAVAHRHGLALARVGHSHACPFDLHALLPVPPDILALGPDHPEALAWLREFWGTPQALRHVTALDRDPQVIVTFWAADWSPWQALRALATTWPGLRFDLRPVYDGP